MKRYNYKKAKRIFNRKRRCRKRLRRCYICNRPMDMAEIPLHDDIEHVGCIPPSIKDFSIELQADYLMTYQCKKCGYVYYPVWMLEEIIDELENKKNV